MLPCPFIQIYWEVLWQGLFLISGFHIASSDSEAAWRGVVESPCVHVICFLFFFSPREAVFTVSCLPGCKVLCGFSEWRTASGFSGASTCPLNWCFVFVLNFSAQNKGFKNTVPNCERPGNWWAKIHNRLILYIYIYKSPWTQWNISTKA